MFITHSNSVGAWAPYSSIDYCMLIAINMCLLYYDGETYIVRCLYL